MARKKKSETQTEELKKCLCGHEDFQHDILKPKKAKCFLCKCPKFFEDNGEIKNITAEEQLAEDHSKKPAPEELDGMPGRDEVGQAAHNVLTAEKALAGAEMALHIARQALIKIMKSYERKSINIEGRTFTRRHYDAKETIVVS